MVRLTEDYPKPEELKSISVQYRGKKRLVTCYCGQTVASSIVPHLKKKHPQKWNEWVDVFINLRGKGYTLKRIMKLFGTADGRLLFSWTVIERAIRAKVEAGKVDYRPPPKREIKYLGPPTFCAETTTLWDFPSRGDWAVHTGDYRGNWPPQIPRNLIEKFTQKGDTVLDVFAGGGTTLIEAWLLDRRSVGIDISNVAIQTTNAKIAELLDYTKRTPTEKLDLDIIPIVIQGNSIKLTRLLDKNEINKDRIKLICVHPPYLSSLKYTLDGDGDLSLISDPVVFCRLLSRIAVQVYKVLHCDGTCAVLIGDTRKNGKLCPLGFKVLNTFLKRKFRLENIIIKTQNKDRSSEFYLKDNSLDILLAHEYLFILKK